MPIGWSEAQRRRVQEILELNPIESSKCADAARQIMPVAKAVDPQTRACKLVGKDDAPFILAHAHGAFFHHVATELVAHMVDALTGATGIRSVVYLQEFWQYPTEIDIVDVDLGDSSL